MQELHDAVHIAVARRLLIGLHVRRFVPARRIGLADTRLPLPLGHGRRTYAHSRGPNQFTIHIIRRGARVLMHDAARCPQLLHTQRQLAPALRFRMRALAHKTPSARDVHGRLYRLLYFFNTLSAHGGHVFERQRNSTGRQNGGLRQLQQLRLGIEHHQNVSRLDFLRILAAYCIGHV